MPVKKITKEIKPKEEKAKAPERYWYAVGRRKASIAKVRLMEAKSAGQAELKVNGKKMEEYFPTFSLQNHFLAPLKATEMEGKFSAVIDVYGGGKKGQAGASSLGIARALVVFQAELKKVLKAKKLMTRDSRVVERKKPGLKKARRAPQWAKR